METKENMNIQINEDKTLKHMRIEVQKIIDNHLKDGERFSVMDYGKKELTILIELLTWQTTREDLEKRHKQNIKDLNMIYEEIICEYDLIKALKNLTNETKIESSSLSADISLNRDLDKSNFA